MYGPHTFLQYMFHTKLTFTKYAIQNCIQVQKSVYFNIIRNTVNTVKILKKKKKKKKKIQLETKYIQYTCFRL